MQYRINNNFVQYPLIDKQFFEFVLDVNDNTLTEFLKHRVRKVKGAIFPNAAFATTEDSYFFEKFTYALHDTKKIDQRRITVTYLDVYGKTTIFDIFNTLRQTYAVNDNFELTGNNPNTEFEAFMRIGIGVSGGASADLQTIKTIKYKHVLLERIKWGNLQDFQPGINEIEDKASVLTVEVDLVFSDWELL